MYEELSAIWGTMRLPSRAADRVRMFPTWWVKTIHGYGVEFDGARYAPPLERESDFLRGLRGKRSQHNLRPELRGRWPIQRHPSDITRAYFEDPDTGEFEMLHMTHLPEGLVMSDAIWQRVKRRFSELGGDPRDTVGRQQAAAGIVRELEGDPAWKRLAAQTAIEYEQQYRDARDDEPSGDGEVVPPREAFQFDRDLVKRVDAAIKITSLAEIRGGSPITNSTKSNGRMTQYSHRQARAPLNSKHGWQVHARRLPSLTPERKDLSDLTEQEQDAYRRERVNHLKTMVPILDRDFQDALTQLDSIVRANDYDSPAPAPAPSSTAPQAAGRRVCSSSLVAWSNRTSSRMPAST